MNAKNKRVLTVIRCSSEGWLKTCINLIYRYDRSGGYGIDTGRMRRQGGELIEVTPDSDGDTDTYRCSGNRNTTSDFHTGTEDDRYQDSAGEVYLSVKQSSE